MIDWKQAWIDSKQALIDWKQAWIDPKHPLIEWKQSLVAAKQSPIDWKQAMKAGILHLQVRRKRITPGDESPGSLQKPSEDG